MHRLLQSLAPQLLITKFVSYFANSPRFAKLFIRWFSRRYQVNLSEAKTEELAAYKTFNAFFTRALKESARPIAPSKSAFVSPADGVISQFGEISEGRLIQAKGRTFSSLEFLGGDKDLASPFVSGHFFTIYLSPRDYHRVHFPFDCTIEKMLYIPGKLFSVSLKTAECIPNLFARNERLCVFVKTPFGPSVIVLVGAMIVAGIQTVWGGEIKRSTMPQYFDYSAEQKASLSFKKGAELGQFKLGSTVVVLTPKEALLFQEGLKLESFVKMGEALGEIKGVI
jgi:phosphatidylserine decarboxylase